MNASEFPKLANLIGAYFHQDYDIEGPELENVVDAYIRVTDKGKLAALIADIDRFLAISDPTLDDIFIETFEPDIVANAFRSTTREFLLAIRDHVRRQLSPAP